VTKRFGFENFERKMSLGPQRKNKTVSKSICFALCLYSFATGMTLGAAGYIEDDGFGVFINGLGGFHITTIK